MKHLTFEDRITIERMYKAGFPVSEIARTVQHHRSTIYRELKKGSCELLSTHYEKYISYSATIGENHARSVLALKGPDLKIEKDFTTAEFVAQKVKEGFSPAVVSQLLRFMPGFTYLSPNTIYRYLDDKVLSSVDNNDLIYGKAKKKKEHKAASPWYVQRGKNISSRPSVVANREEFGHWEMDSVVGKKVGKGETIITLTERKSRYELIFKVPDKSAGSVVRVLDKLSRNTDFKDVFKTITVDNGIEFSDVDGMQTYKGKKRTDVYYCHPYCSWERGTNECYNRIVRRFLPKGQSLTKVTQKQCSDISDWMNHYPRKILGWKTPSELFEGWIREKNLKFVAFNP